MSKTKAKAKSGIGKGTGKKGWNRWKAGANKAKSAKPYTSKGVKRSDATNVADKNEVAPSTSSIEK